jgi:hypothetical protein
MRVDPAVWQSEASAVVSAQGPRGGSSCAVPSTLIRSELDVTRDAAGLELKSRAASCASVALILVSLRLRVHDIARALDNPQAAAHQDHVSPWRPA